MAGADAPARAAEALSFALYVYDICRHGVLRLGQAQHRRAQNHCARFTQREAGLHVCVGMAALHRRQSLQTFELCLSYNPWCTPPPLSQELCKP